MARLNKYYESRSNDKRFKLLHEETSYLDILRGRSGLVEQDPDAEVVEETVLDDGQTLLNEEEEITLAEFKGKAGKIAISTAVGGTIAGASGYAVARILCKKQHPNDEAAYKKCMWGEKKKKAQKEDIEFTDEQIMAEWMKDNVSEVSISIARKASKQLSKKALAARKARLTPGLARGGKRKVLMGRV